MLNGTIIRRVEKDENFLMLLFKFGEKKYGRTYTGSQYRNYPDWKDLKVGDLVGGLQWKDEKLGIIDADSPVHLV